MTHSFQAYGIREHTSADSELERALEEITINGFTIVEDVLSAAQLQEAARRIDAVYEVQAAEIGGTQNLRRINDEMIARGLLAYDEFFLEVAVNPKIIFVLEALLGDYFTLLQQNAITNVPGTTSYQTSWHRDLVYQHFIPSRPIAISALICVDDFSEVNGGTYVLPSSHKVERFPSQTFVEKHERVANARAGSAIVFDSMLFHRGGQNRSESPRRGLNHLYALPFIKQQISFPEMLAGKYSDDEFLRRFLGYVSEPASSVREWRLQRLEGLEETGK